VQNPARSSQLGSAGGDRERLLGLEAGGIDGALLSYAEATMAVRKGMNVLADANLFLMGVGEPITSHLKFLDFLSDNWRVRVCRLLTKYGFFSYSAGCDD
jgi:hypothetical protein